MDVIDIPLQLHILHPLHVKHIIEALQILIHVIIMNPPNPEHIAIVAEREDLRDPLLWVVPVSRPDALPGDADVLGSDTDVIHEDLVEDSLGGRIETSFMFIFVDVVVELGEDGTDSIL